MNWNLVCLCKYVHRTRNMKGTFQELIKLLTTISKLHLMQQRVYDIFIKRMFISEQLQTRCCH